MEPNNFEDRSYPEETDFPSTEYQKEIAPSPEKDVYADAVVIEDAENAYKYMKNHNPDLAPPDWPSTKFELANGLIISWNGEKFIILRTRLPEGVQKMINRHRAEREE